MKHRPHGRYSQTEKTVGLLYCRTVGGSAATVGPSLQSDCQTVKPSDSHYRILATNKAGASTPSNTVAAVL